MLRRGAGRRSAAALGRARRATTSTSSGTLGDARLALEAFRGTVALRRRRLRAGAPGDGAAAAARRARRARCAAWRRSAIDVSDGLAGDLGHVLRRSGVGAVVDVDALPRSAALAAQPLALQRECLLAGGDDYELVFTALPSRRDAVAAAAAAAPASPVTRIGRIEAGARRCAWSTAAASAVASAFACFDHFRA